MIPGVPVHTYTHDGDDQAFADWMLELIDEGPDRLAVIEITRPASMRQLEHMEETFLRAYDIAKAERPDLSVKIMPVVHRASVGPRRADALVVLHEHRWVGGECVNGCRDKRPVDDPHDEA